MTITTETTLFLIFLLDGAIVGLLFDIFRILRKSFKTPDFITYIEDILFGIISGSILIFSIIMFNNGELRLFIFLGIILGLVLYMLTISKYVIKICVKVLQILTKTCGTIFKVVFFPVCLILRKVKQEFIKIQKHTKKLKKDTKNEGFVVEK